MSGPPPLPPSSGPPPGWYPDPYGMPGYRWWNGVAWTDDRSGGDAGAAGRGGLIGVGELLGETFRLLGPRLGHLFTLAAVLLLAPTVLGLAALYAALDGVRYADGEWTGAEPARFVAAGMAAVVVLVATLAFTGATNRQGMAAANGDPEPWTSSLAGGLRRTPRIVGANLAVWVPVVVLAVVVLVAAALVPVLLLAAVPAVVVGVVVVWVRSGLLTTAASVAPRGTGSIGAAFGATRGRFWAFFGRFLVIGVLYWAVQAGGSIATAPVAGASTAPDDDAVLVDEETGELLRLDFGELVTDNVGVLGFTLVVSALVQAAGSALSSLARVTLYRSTGSPVDPALTPDTEPTA